MFVNGRLDAMSSIVSGSIKVGFEPAGDVEGRVISRRKNSFSVSS
jgi:hypothetical protein